MHASQEGISDVDENGTSECTEDICTCNKSSSGKEVDDTVVLIVDDSHHAGHERPVEHSAGKRPFECDQCQKTFDLKRSLKVHMRMHTGDIPFFFSVINARSTLFVRDV